MNTDLERAKQALQIGGYTCVLQRGDICKASNERGVRPLLALLSENTTDFSAADRAVGKGAAFCYVLLRVRAVYAEVLSVPAKQVLENNGIAVYSDSLVEKIINRAGTGQCPIESAVMAIDEPQAAIEKIKETLEKLR